MSALQHLGKWNDPPWQVPAQWSRCNVTRLAGAKWSSLVGALQHPGWCQYNWAGATRHPCWRKVDLARVSAVQFTGGVAATLNYSLGLLGFLEYAPKSLNLLIPCAATRGWWLRHCGWRWSAVVCITGCSVGTTPGTSEGWHAAIGDLCAETMWLVLSTRNCL